MWKASTFFVVLMERFLAKSSSMAALSTAQIVTCDRRLISFARLVAVRIWVILCAFPLEVRNNRALRRVSSRFEAVVGWRSCIFLDWKRAERGGERGRCFPADPGVALG
ncbi:hypothetical protein Ancab_024960 [Ancistrocladus abbreviatus]